MYSQVDHMPPSFPTIRQCIIDAEGGGADLAESGRHDPSGFDRTSGAILGPTTVASLTLYVAAAFLHIIALRRIPLSVALPARPPLIFAQYLWAIFYTMRR